MISLDYKPGTSEVVYAPTGAGKSEIFLAIIRHAVAHGKRVVVYCCRNLLLQQLIKKFDEQELDYGVIASQFPDKQSNLTKIQLCSIDTVYARREKSGIPKADLVIVDEAHQQKETKARTVFKTHDNRGCCRIGFTATPVDLGNLYDKLFISCLNSELRDKRLEFPAHVPAHVFGGAEIDTRNLSHIKTGEFSLAEIRKRVWTPSIFGHVFKSYSRLNPHKKPTILFAPGIEESKWFVDEFERKGIRAAHIDGEDCYFDGKEHKSKPEVREEIIAKLKKGKIHVICNRYVLREGIDIPELAHLILACAMGSIVSYIQTVGRVMRNHSSLDRVIVQDHGGNWWRHGSPNADRTEWEDMFNMSSSVASSIRKHKVQRGEEKCAIQCPMCDAIRAFGSFCHNCGYKHEKSKRAVIMKNGSLIEMTGDPIPKIKVAEAYDTEKRWIECYYRCKRSNMTFKQALGLFVNENKYYPPEDLRMMPLKTIDWWAKIKDVDQNQLR